MLSQNGAIKMSPVDRGNGMELGSVNGSLMDKIPLELTCIVQNKQVIRMEPPFAKG